MLHISRHSAPAPSPGGRTARVAETRLARARRSAGRGTPNRGGAGAQGARGDDALRAVRERLACGAIARLAQSLSMYPVDTIKTRVQVSRGLEVFPRVGGVGGFARMRAAVAKGALYRGLPLALLGNVPYGMISFGLYETIKTEIFEKRWPNFPRTLGIVISACIGDTLGAFALTPAEVVKSKTQAGLFQSSTEAAVTIFRRGGLRGFYQGHIAALCRDVPFRAVQLSLYENARQRYSAWLVRHRGREMVPLENLLMGASIGMATAATTTPLDVVRTRMMSQSPGAGAAYANAWDCLSKTVRGEGFLALYKGLGPRMLLIGPSAAVFFVAYEASKKFFRVRASKLVACNLRGMRRTTKATGAMARIR